MMQGTMIDLPPDSALIADTPRCRLVPAVVGDAHQIAELLSDDRLHSFSGRTPPTEAELADRLRHRHQRRSADGTEVWLDWMVLLVPLGGVIGQVGAVVTDDGRAVISFLIGLRWQGHGFATEAASAMVRLLEAHVGVRTLSTLIPPGHAAAHRVAERLGMTPSGTLSGGWEAWEGCANPIHEQLSAPPRRRSPGVPT